MCESYYDKLQTYFGGRSIQCQYIDTDAFVLSIISNDIKKDLKNLEDLFDFGNLNENHEILSNKSKKSWKI